MRLPAIRPTRFGLCAAAVVALGFALRGWGLAGAGITFSDEGLFLCEARWCAGAVRNIPDALRLGWLRWRTGGDRRADGADGADGAADADGAAAAELRARMAERTAGGSPPIHAKYTHDLLVGLVMLAVGDRDWVGHAEGAFFGGLTVLLVVWWTRALAGEAAALVAGLALAVSPLHLLLTRGALAEGDCSFFFTLAAALTWAALGGRRENALALLFAAGLAGGTAFTCNSRTAVVAPALWCLYGAALATRERPLAGMRERGLVWLSVGMVLPLLAWESVYRLGDLLVGEPLSSRFYPRFFERQTALVLGQGSSELGLGDGSCLPVFLGRYLSWPFVVLALAGLVAAARTRGRDALAIGLPSAWVLAFFLLRTQEQPLRYLGAALPFLAVGAGAALRLAPGARVGAVGGAAALCLLLGSACGSQEWRPVGSGFAPACAWLVERRAAGAGERYFCEDAPIAAYYDPSGDWDRRFPATASAFATRVANGWRYVMVTPGLLVHYGVPPYARALLGELMRDLRPVEFAHPAGALRYFTYEHNLFGTRTFAQTEERADVLAAEGGRIRIYDRAPWRRTQAGIAAFRAGRHAAAREEFAAALGDAPEYPAARLGRARCRLALGEEAAAALADLSSLPAPLQQDADVRQDRIVALLRTGARAAAETELAQLKAAGVPPRADVVAALREGRKE
ncbi:MAG: glycosyltransferase family 39 protein [Planctomycetes bacterium]|nr:glycosyltransferase family 39 protein [Planctomycetota bacterium]